MTDVSSPTEMFDSLACAFADAGIRTSPAELHGVAVGLLSGQADTAPAQVLSALASHAEVSAFDGGAADVLVAALEQSRRELTGDGLGLSLLLPADEEDLGLRVAALAQWCEGFLNGFGLASAGLTDKDLPPGLQEALSDLAAISQVETPEDEGDEQEELFAQVFEHVRMAATLVFTELALKQRQQSGDNGNAGNQPAQH